MKKFDLNIEKVLEHWTISHALREIIANALDESILSGTKEPIILKSEFGKWHIRDFGRGLKHNHLTQNENNEKIKNAERVIGKFGVGLKDALATFDRRNIHILIKSKYNDITIKKLSKEGFADITTLHAIVQEPSDSTMVGTEFVFEGLQDADVEKAKDFFLLYSGENVIEKTRYGTLLEKANNKNSRIYVNGLCVAEEDNLLFSYNITSPTQKLLKSLNRERTNVGRSAYTDRIKSILLTCKGSVFAKELVNDLEKMQKGEAHDELQWIDVQVHACKILNSEEKVLFLTAEDLIGGNKYIHYAKGEGHRIVTIPDTLAQKLPQVKDISGNEMVNLDHYSVHWNDNFTFAFVNVKDLSQKEKEIFELRHRIEEWFPRNKKPVKEIKVSEIMRPDSFTGADALGLWEESSRTIIIKRSQLRSVEAFAGTLIHEFVHAYTDTDDETIAFEHELTMMLGEIATMVLQNKEKDTWFKRILKF
ncbi:ATP-binding protein [Bacillus pacificus]|uniref:ATP-binding protein n=1 Tax=Bacillus pacificus TaxID=2026187 RepID=UPI001E4D4E36|nr:ATP-binding protein [Bacillus pacificus]MCC2388692.1 ATP-binding protein [Bacillus pacificus]